MPYWKKPILILAAAMLFTGFLSIGVFAGFNEKINYQGKLTDSGNMAVSDGEYCMKFVIHTASTGDASIWSEEWDAATEKVDISSGLFSIMLGTQASISSIDFDQTPLYLEVLLDPGCDDTYEEEFYPRKQLGAVPASFESKRLAGYTWAVPAPIGSATPDSGAFTTLSASGAFTTSNGSILSSASGILTFGGSGGTYNENLTLNFDGANNTVIFGSTTGAASLDLGAFSLTTTGTGTFGDAVIGGVGIAWNAGDSILYFDNNIGITGGGSFILDTANNWYWEGGTGELITQKGSFQEFSTAGGNIYDFWDGFNYYLYTPNLYVTGGGGIELDGGSINFDSIGGGDLYNAYYIYGIDGQYLEFANDSTGEIRVSASLLLDAGGYPFYIPPGYFYANAIYDYETGMSGFNFTNYGSVQVAATDFDLNSAFIHDTSNGFVQIYGQENAGATGLRVYNTDGFIMFQVDTLGDSYTRRNFTIGAGVAATDYTLTFNGETTDGVLTWMEDEDYFAFSDDILMASTERIYFRDSAISINSADDGHLDLTADTFIDFNIGATQQIVLTDGKLAPTTNNDIDLGDDTHRFKDLYLVGATIHMGTSGDEGTLTYTTGTDTWDFTNNISTTGNITTGTLTLYSTGDMSLVGFMTGAGGGYIDMTPYPMELSDFKVGSIEGLYGLTDASLNTLTMATDPWYLTVGFSVGGDLTVSGGQGYSYGADSWTLPIQYTDFIYSNSNAWPAFDLQSQPYYISVEQDMRFNYKNMLFAEGFDADIHVEASTGYAYEGGDMTLRAGDGLLGGGAPNATGGTLFLKGGTSSGATEGAVYIYGSIAEDVFETDIENTPVPFQSMTGGMNSHALPLFLYRGTGTQYKNWMVCYTYNGSTYTSRSSESRTAFGTAFTLLADNNDYVYVGLQDHPWGTVYFDIATAGSGLTVLWEYWNGSDWIDLDDISGPAPSDGTINFAQSGAVSFILDYMTDWTTTAVSGTTAYWVRASTSAVTIAPTCYKTGTSYFATPVFRAYTDSSTVSYYSAWNGYNGIYTAAPQAMLHIAMPNIAGVETLRLAAGGSTGDALLKFYYNATLNASIWYDASVGDLFIDNNYNNTAGEIYFRTKTLGTAVNNLILKDTLATLGTNVTIGSGAAGTDYILKFDGETSDLTETWMEDEGRLDLSLPNIAGAGMWLKSSGTTGLVGLDIGTSTAIKGRLWYDHNQGDLYLDNAYNNDAGEIYLRTKTAGTPVNNLILSPILATLGTDVRSDYHFGIGTAPSASTVWNGRYDSSQGESTGSGNFMVHLSSTIAQTYGVTSQNWLAACTVANPTSYGGLFQGVNYNYTNPPNGQTGSVVGGRFETADYSGRTYTATGTGRYTFTAGYFYNINAAGDWTTNNPPVTTYGIYFQNGVPTGYGSNHTHYQIWSPGGNALWGSDGKFYFRDTAISVNSVDDGHLDLTADVSIDFNAPEVIFPYGVGAPTLTTNGSLSIAYVDPNHRIYFYSNGGLHYVNETAGFEIPSFETTDPLSGEEIKEGDFVMGMINYTVSDGALHGLWVKWDSIKKDLIEEIKNSLVIQLSVLEGETGQDGEDIQDSTDADVLFGWLKSALAWLGLSIENGIAQAKEFISDKITTKTARIDKIEIADKVTGEIYCTWIENGEWVKVKEDCEAVDRSVKPQIEPPVEPPIDPPVDPGATDPSISDPEPEPDSEPEPTPEPDPEPNPEPSPEPEPVPEPAPEPSPVPEPAPEPASVSTSVPTSDSSAAAVPGPAVE